MKGQYKRHLMRTMIMNKLCLDNWLMKFCQMPRLKPDSNNFLGVLWLNFFVHYSLCCLYRGKKLYMIYLKGQNNRSKWISCPHFIHGPLVITDLSAKVVQLCFCKLKYFQILFNSRCTVNTPRYSPSSRFLLLSHTLVHQIQDFLC